MHKFLAVYNMKSSNFINPTILTVKEFMNSDDFISVCLVLATDVEDAFSKLNVDSKVGLTFLQDTIKVVADIIKNDPFGVKFPSVHTSMSVGDVLIEYTPTNGLVYHMCLGNGWVVMK